MKKREIKEWIIRSVILVIGLIIAHLGVTLFLLSNLGADPFNVFVQGLRCLTEIIGFDFTHGTVHMFISFLIILILLIKKILEYISHIIRHFLCILHHKIHFFFIISF